VPAAKKNERKRIHDSHRSQSSEYRDYEAFNSDYPENYDYDYNYGYHQQDQQDRRLIPQHDNQQLPQRNKLLLIVLDGFRWDYFQLYQDRTGQELEGFKRFKSGGVRTEYLESVFPAESFPAWQTIQTGLYPENHGIVGNQFYDNEVHKSKGSYMAFFNIDDERTTANERWWNKDEVEPIWATAAKQDISFATFLWGRCDIAYEHAKRLTPAYCENYYSTDLTKTLTINVDKAVQQLMNGVDAAIIYDPILEKAAEDFGPISDQVDTKLRQLDEAMMHLESRLNATTMTDFVNVVVVSDHGMTYGHHSPYDVPIRKLKLANHLKDGLYKWIVGSGSHAGVYPSSRENREKIVHELQGVDGIRVYGKHNIPEDLHYKHNKNSPPILVIAEPGTIILSSAGPKQRPSYNRGGRKNQRYHSPQSLVEQTKWGLSGYDPKEPDMRGIFLAKGPDFKATGEEFPPIKLVDVYQVLTHVLGVNPQPNNGTWEHVKDLLVDPNRASSRTISATNLFIVLILGLLRSKLHQIV